MAVCVYRLSSSPWLVGLLDIGWILSEDADVASLISRKLCPVWCMSSAVGIAGNKGNALALSKTGPWLVMKHTYTVSPNTLHVHGPTPFFFSQTNSFFSEPQVYVLLNKSLSYSIRTLMPINSNIQIIYPWLDATHILQRSFEFTQYLT